MQYIIPRYYTSIGMLLRNVEVIQLVWDQTQFLIAKHSILYLMMCRLALGCF